MIGVGREKTSREMVVQEWLAVCHRMPILISPDAETAP